MTIYDASRHLGTSTRHVREMIGAFGIRNKDGDLVPLRKHAGVVFMKDAMFFDNERIAATLNIDPNEVDAILDDGKKRYDYDRHYRYRYSEEKGPVETKKAALSFGLDSKMLERASKLGLIEHDNATEHSGYFIDTEAALETMGLANTHPLPWIEKGGHNE